MAPTDTMTSYLLKLAAVFGLGAAPWFEIIVAVPAGVVMGLTPAVATAAAVAGNVVSIAVLMAVLPRLRNWFSSTFLPRKRHKGEDGLSARYRRFQYLWNRYGVAGAGLGAPVVTGTHLAVVLCVILGASAGRTLAWTTIGILAWGGVLAVACQLGLESLQYLIPEWAMARLQP